VAPTIVDVAETQTPNVAPSVQTQSANVDLSPTTQKQNVAPSLPSSASPPPHSNSAPSLYQTQSANVVLSLSPTPSFNISPSASIADVDSPTPSFTSANLVGIDSPSFNISPANSLVYVNSPTPSPIASASSSPTQAPTYESPTALASKLSPPVVYLSDSPDSTTSSESNSQFVALEFGIRILKSDMATLEEGEWLNDPIIEVYLQLLMLKTKGKGYAMSTLFWPGLETFYERKVDYFAKINVFQYEALYIPIHLGKHWTLAVVNFNNPRMFPYNNSLCYYDSMGGRNEECLEKLELFFRDVHRASRIGKTPLPDFDKVFMSDVANIPRQNNSDDCGVYVLKYTQVLVEPDTHNFLFGPEDVRKFRHQIAREIRALNSGNNVD
jgi:sentrin-specific protease 1